MSVIILEGIDGSGKSTLAHRLFNASPVPTSLLHRGPMEGTVDEEYIEPLLSIEPGRLIIADRWHVGEMIYGPIYRGKALVAGTNNERIEQILTDLHAVRIIMAPPLEKVRQRLAERGEDYLKPQHIEEVYNQYLDFGHYYGYTIIEEDADDTLVASLLQQALGR